MSAYSHKQTFEPSCASIRVVPLNSLVLPHSSWGRLVSEEGVERRLTTILAADVVGYSRLMAADEAGTLTEVVQEN